MTTTWLEHDWYPSPLPTGVMIGERSWLYSSFAFLHCRSERPQPVRIGHDSGIYDGSFFDLAPTGEVRIGNFCSVVGAVFCTDGMVEVHDYAFLAHEVVIADRPVCVPASGGPEASREDNNEGLVIIGENAWVGARAIILGGVHVGRDAIVGAGSVVTTSVPAGTVVAGNPARLVRRLTSGPGEHSA